MSGVFAMPFTAPYGAHPNGKRVMSAEKKHISVSLRVVEEVKCPLPSHAQKYELSQRKQGDSR